MPIGARSLDGETSQDQRMKFKEFPAKTEHVAVSLQHLMDTARFHTAVDSAIYAIQWVHGLAGIPSPTDSPIIYGLR